MLPGRYAQTKQRPEGILQVYRGGTSCKPVRSHPRSTTVTYYCGNTRRLVSIKEVSPCRCVCGSAAPIVARASRCRNIQCTKHTLCGAGHSRCTGATTTPGHRCCEFGVVHSCRYTMDVTLPEACGVKGFIQRPPTSAHVSQQQSRVGADAQQQQLLEPDPEPWVLEVEQVSTGEFMCQVCVRACVRVSVGWTHCSVVATYVHVGLTRPRPRVWTLQLLCGGHEEVGTSWRTPHRAIE